METSKFFAVLGLGDSFDFVQIDSETDLEDALGYRVFEELGGPTECPSTIEIPFDIYTTKRRYLLSPDLVVYVDTNNGTGEFYSFVQPNKIRDQ